MTPTANTPHSAISVAPTHWREVLHDEHGGGQAGGQRGHELFEGGHSAGRGADDEEALGDFHMLRA